MKLSIVTTMYYSEKYIHEFYNRITKSAEKITKSYEIIFVNDGSPDKSLDIAVSIHRKDKKVKVIDLSRNFGHHQAIMTGLANTKGDYIFLIDCDLEENPEYLIDLWYELISDPYYDVVYGIQNKRKGNLYERMTGSLFYKIFNLFSKIRYPANTLTSRLMTKNYVKSVLMFNEAEFDLWSIFVLAGFNQKPLSLEKKSKGSTSYNLIRKIRVAVNTITSMSNRPLYFIFLLGLIITFISIIYVFFLIFKKLIYKEILEGWTSILVSIWFIGGIIIFSIGIIGIYLSKIFIESKRRPSAIIKKYYGEQTKK